MYLRSRGTARGMSFFSIDLEMPVFLERAVSALPLVRTLKRILKRFILFPP
jgi:hypothetical protein